MDILLIKMARQLSIATLLRGLLSICGLLVWPNIPQLPLSTNITQVKKPRSKLPNKFKSKLDIIRERLKKKSIFQKLISLYDFGAEKLDHEFSIELILNHLRELRIFFKNKALDEKTRFLIQHNHKNIINLESTSDEEGGNGSSSMLKRMSLGLK